MEAAVETRKVPVTVFFCASNQVEVEAPANLEGDELEDFVQKKLREELPEVLAGCSFEFPSYAQVEGHEGEFDID